MKKIQKKSPPIKKILSVALVCLAVVVIYGVCAYATKIWPFNNTTPGTTTSTPSDNGQQNANKDDISPNDGDSGKTTDQVPVDASLTATINELSQANGMVTFQATINSAQTGGKCSLVFTNPNDKPVTRTVDAVVSNSVATCGPIQISDQEFTYLGEWTATLRYYINDNQVVVTKAITIQ